MRFGTLLALCFLAGQLAGQTEGKIEVASFNIRILGEAKMAKPKVVTILEKILDRYDLIMIQELRAAKPDAINALLKTLNSSSGNPYDMVVGPKVGRSNSKEQYVFFYRTDRFMVTDHYGYVDSFDKFEREPYIVRFKTLTTSTLPSDFAVVNIHTKPDNESTPLEIDALADVYDDVVKTWNVEDVIITGDLNADCDYVVKDDWKSIRLRSQKRFHWLTPDTADTTVSSTTHCAYDRFVVAGSKFIDALPIAGVFHFDKDYKLKAKAAKAVSDHYPIEMTFV